jgi:hypothetical protein
MRINGIYRVNFNPETKEFTPERIEFDHNCLNLCSLDFKQGEDASEGEGLLWWVRDHIKEEFIPKWMEYASEEDKSFTKSALARKARIIKAGKYYFQFFDFFTIVDVSTHYERLLDRYGIQGGKKTKDGDLVYFWKDNTHKKFDFQVEEPNIFDDTRPLDAYRILYWNPTTLKELAHLGSMEDILYPIYNTKGKNARKPK